MISTSCSQLSLYRVLHLREKASHHNTAAQRMTSVERERREEGGAEGGVKVQRNRDIVKKTPRDGCTAKPQSGSCDTGMVRLRGKCSGLALQRAV